MVQIPTRAAFGKFFGSAASGAAGFAAGTATAPVLRPVVQYLENEAWSAHPDRPPTIYTVVRGVAEGKIAEGDARDWSHQQGFNDGVFDALLAASESGPPFGNLLDARRRNLISGDDFHIGLKRLGIETRWWPALDGLVRTYLSPSEAANARQQQFIGADEQRQTAALYGIEPQDADVQFELAGLPPGVETALEMWRRNIIDQGRFAQIVAEGHTKTKYTANLEALKQRVLGASVYVRLFLKGWITRDAMHAGGALTGYSAEDLDQWYLAEGRPATVHQVHIGYARGATLPGAANEKDAITKAVQESDIRPEYTDLLYAQRYSYPSAFVLRSLVQTGAITQAEGEQALLYSGWEPTFAKTVAAAWAGGTTGTATDTHVTKAQTQLWTATHGSYVKDRIDDVAATTALGAAGVSGATIPAVLQTWQAEREIVRGGLTPANIKKAYQEQSFTLDEAVARLVDLGWSVADANTYLPL